RREYQLHVTPADGLPERVGPFRVRGALRRTEREAMLLAEDAQLGRTVWLWLRPATEPPRDAVRRDVSRATRVRWVGCGKQGDWEWDAFLAPAGVPLPALVADARLSWTDARPILEGLADELAASCADGTLPRCLTADQVWVDAAGRVQLLGTPLTGEAANVAEGESDQQRALCFLRRVAVT